MKIWLTIFCLMTCCCDKRSGRQSDTSSMAPKVKTLREAANWLSVECSTRQPNDIGLLLAEMPTKPQVDTRARPNSFARAELAQFLVKIGPSGKDIIKRVNSGAAECYIWYERNDKDENWFAGILYGEKIEYFEGEW